MKTMPEPVLMSDLPGDIRIVFWDQAMRNERGQHIKVECPYCHEHRWVLKVLMGEKYKRTTFCKAHKEYAQISWSKAGEFNGNNDVIVDYTRQKLDRMSSGRANRSVFIWASCPDCLQERWVRVNSIRFNANHTTRCTSCSAKRKFPTPADTPSWNGGTSIYNGYRYVHEWAWKQRITPLELELVKKTLKIHRGGWAEHRVVALLKYGADAMKDGVVVRHIDGNKINNAPENLILGTSTDNVQDHADDRREMKMWRGLALQFARLAMHLMAEKAKK